MAMTPEEIAQRLAGSPVLGVDGRSVGSVLGADVGADGTVSVCIDVEPGAVPPPLRPLSIGYSIIEASPPARGYSGPAPDAPPRDVNFRVVEVIEPTPRETWAMSWEAARHDGDDGDDDLEELDGIALQCLRDRSAVDPLTLPPERGRPRTRIDGQAAALRQMLSDTSRPLDAIVSSYGAQRMEGESDADLRGRIVATVMSPDAIRGHLLGLYETWVGEGLADPVALDLVSRNVDVDDHTHPD